SHPAPPPPPPPPPPPSDEPRIYFGEETDDYVIVKGSTPEFDYPKGTDNVYATYAGAGGVAVGGIARRALFAQRSQAGKAGRTTPPSPRVTPTTSAGCSTNPM